MLRFGMDRRAGQIASARHAILADQSGRRSMRRTDEAGRSEALRRRPRSPTRKGFEYLARLVGAPNADIAADDLAGSSVLLKPQGLWDDVAIGALRQQARVLRERIEHADAAGDAVESERAQSELSELVRATRVDTQPDGSSRAFGDTRERARTAVTKAIARTIRQLDEPAEARVGPEVTPEPSRRGQGLSRRRLLSSFGVGAAGLAVSTVVPIGAAAAQDAGKSADANGSAGKGSSDPTSFSRMFDLPSFASPTPELVAALLELGRPGGILDAKDPLDRTPKDLIVDLSLSANNANNPA